MRAFDYPTQKPEALLERIIQRFIQRKRSRRRFLLRLRHDRRRRGKAGPQVDRQRPRQVRHPHHAQTADRRAAGTEGRRQDYRAFEILNLGKYERQHYIGVNPNLREAEQQKQLEAKEAAFLDLILRAYKAEKTDGFATFHGKKAGRLVAVGPVNLPVTRLFVEEIILECRQKHITKVDILGFEFEMGLFPNVLDEATCQRHRHPPKYIPAEVFDKRAVEKNQVVFHDVAAIEVKPHRQGKDAWRCELTDFSVFYSQDSTPAAEASLKEKASKIVVEKGQIVR